MPPHALSSVALSYSIRARPDRSRSTSQAAAASCSASKSNTWPPCWWSLDRKCRWYPATLEGARKPGRPKSDEPPRDILETELALGLRRIEQARSWRRRIDRAGSDAREVPVEAKRVKKVSGFSMTGRNSPFQLRGNWIRARAPRWSPERSGSRPRTEPRRPDLLQQRRRCPALGVHDRREPPSRRRDERRSRARKSPCSRIVWTLTSLS